MKKLLSLLLLTLLCSIGTVWGETVTFDFAGGSSTGLTIEKNQASWSYSIVNTTTNNIPVLDSYFLALSFASTSTGTITITTNDSYTNIKTITFNSASTDNSNPKIAVFIVDGDNKETSVQSAMSMSSGTTKTWRATPYSIDLSSNLKTGKVRFKLTTGSSGKYAGLDNISITTATPQTVTFNAGSHGTCATASLTEASAGAGVILPSVTANTGYTFNGWYTAASEGTKAGNAGATYKPSDDITLYAQYSVNTYTITLDDKNDGSGNGSATATYNSNKLTSISAPTWAGKGVVGYYADAECTILIADAAGNLQANKTGYTGDGGVWTATENKTLYTKWLSANNATFNDGNYTIGGSALDLSTLFTSSSDGAVTYSIKDANGTGAAIAGSSFTATTAGTATVTVTQAATGTYAGATKDAAITVANNPLGSHTLTWTMKIGKTTYTSLLDDASSTSSAVTAGGALSAGSSSIVPTSATGQSDRTIAVTGDNVGSSRGANSYIEFPFTISAGYSFIPTSASVKVANITTAKKYDLVILNSDGSESVERATYNSSKTDGSVETISWANISGIILSGSGKLRVYAYYASGTDGHRFGSPITITGIVVRETPEVISINGTAKYATYHNYSNAYVMPAGLEGIVVSGNEGTTLTLNTAYNAGDIVPAHEPLILHAADIDENTNFSLYLTYTASEPGVNMLKGLAANGTTIGEGKHYHLSYDTEDPAGTVGFYYGAADGNPFSLNADKAYLVIPAGSTAPSRFLLNEEENNATNVENIEANEKAVKFIENGRILIKKNGIVYDALGRIVK